MTVPQEVLLAYFRRTVSPPYKIRLLSRTNNLVFLISDERARHYILKIITDKDLDPAFLKQCNATLSGSIRVPEILRVDPFDPEMGGYPMILQYVEGRDAADLMESGALDVTGQRTLVEHLLQVVQATRQLEIISPGFGLYKRSRSMHESFSVFIDQYLTRYFGRLQQLGLSSIPWAEYDAALRQVFVAHVAPTTTKLGVFPFDLNLKNIIFPPAGQPVLLNVPIIGRGDLRFGIGAAAAQLRGTWMHQLFREMSPSEDLIAVMFYEGLTVLGILAFHASAGQAVHNARAWGTRSLLLQELQAIVEALS